MKTVKFAQVLKFSENLVKVDKPEEERYVTVLLYGRGVIEREIKEGKVPVAFTGYKAHAGQLIISTINARNGAAGIIPAELDGAVVSKDFPLFDIDHECVDEQYLLYYLWSDSFIHKAEQNSFGATMPRLHVKPFLNMQMRLPALSEQKRRTHTLCHVESLLNAQSHLLTKLDELVKSRFVEMFGEPVNNSKGYPIHQLSDHILFLTSGSRGWAQYYTDKGEWFITIKNVKDCRISVDDVQCINPPKNAEAERTRLREGDLLISITADLGRTGVVTKEIAEHGAYNNQHLTCIRLDRLVLDPLYVAFFMESEAGKRQFEAKNMSAVKAGLNFDSIRSLKLIVPPLALQKEFSAFVAEVDKSKLAVKQSLEKLETLKKSLMQQYFG